MIPTYTCHKEVQAFKVADIVAFTNGDFQLIPEDDSVDSVIVGDDYYRKHGPHVGGYYVQYADGYQSFSPAQAFENGYKLKEVEPSEYD